MSHLKRVSYCVSIAVVVTALASLFDSEVGWSLAFPGEVICGFLTAFLTTGEDFGPVIAWQVPNVVFYTVMFYGISWAYTGLREEREDARAHADDVLRSES